ncbi:hypothetical protein [Prosthecobacter dejongeii]|uniref:Uncharacterized protein n=1 Tax=Prosthecobacter dejongeii TaxID=48465 RepID=A0A7W8DQ79_9BACT|nr:hypothetical protein [Prosthecobacter dejongeii]MBB5037671.1 hypothetical protein [Prosthecobacter dejongeii]
MNPQTQKTNDKQLLSLHRERKKLRRKQMETALLEPPIRRGWKRLHFLTEDAERREDADVLRAILEKINVIRYHWRRNFKPTNSKRRQQLYITDHQLSWLWPTDFGPRRLLDAKWISYFKPALALWSGYPQWVLEFSQPELFELRVVPHLQTEGKILDPETESRLAWIEAKLEGPGRYRLEKLTNCSRSYGQNLRRDRLREKIAQERLFAALAGDVEAEERSLFFWLFPSASRRLIGAA